MFAKLKPPITDLHAFTRSIDVIYRVTFGFEGKGEGWSENHQLSSTVPLARNLRTICENVAQKRANFLGRPFTLNALRISAYLQDNGSRAPKNHFFRRLNFSSQNPTTTGDAEPGNVCLIHRGFTDAVGNQNSTFLGGPPDDSVNFGGNVIFGAAGLATALTVYEAALIGDGTYAFGWGQSSTPEDYEITDVSQETDGTVILTINRDFVVPTPAAAFYPGRIRALNNGKSPLNGQVLVRPLPINARTLQTKEQIAFVLAQVNGHIKVYKATRPFLPYTAFITDFTTGEHKRGKPFGSPRGRATNRTRA